MSCSHDFKSLVWFPVAVLNYLPGVCSMFVCKRDTQTVLSLWGSLLCCHPNWHFLWQAIKRMLERSSMRSSVKKAAGVSSRWCAKISPDGLSWHIKNSFFIYQTTACTLPGATHKGSFHAVQAQLLNRVPDCESLSKIRVIRLDTARCHRTQSWMKQESNLRSMVVGPQPGERLPRWRICASFSLHLLATLMWPQQKNLEVKTHWNPDSEKDCSGLLPNKLDPQLGVWVSPPARQFLNFSHQILAAAYREAWTIIVA